MIEDIKKIQSYLKEKNLDAYIIYMSDDHGSEYIVDYYKTIKFLTGFTGSSATVVISQNESRLWTDGRYFIQAKNELASTNTFLMKSGEDGVQTIFEYIKSLSSTPKVALDFKCTSLQDANNLIKLVPNVNLIDDSTIVDSIFINRPSLPSSKSYIIPDEYTGLSINDKLNRVKLLCESYKYILVTALDDIAYIFNLRGLDIDYNPVNYAFALISKEKVILYINKNKLEKSIVNLYLSLAIEIKDYYDIYNDAKRLEGKVLVDESTLNYSLSTLIKEKTSRPIFPIKMQKAKKNKIEIANIKRIHILDSIALIKFIYFLKTNFNKVNLTEISLAEKLEAFRSENKAYICPSFETICGFNENAAIIHYTASKETNKNVNGSGLLLVDSGGQYKYGTTDITRTFALGNISNDIKHDFTLVLKSHIDLAKTKFIKGTTGSQLDMISRAPLYNEGKDYKHGTGHGVGYLLNVHEGPQSISIYRTNSCAFTQGLLTSNEPGLYIEGQYGIRHENLILCELDKENENGIFYKFDTVTLVPFDLDGIDATMLDIEEKNWLNNYHKTIYETISPYLDQNLKDYLKTITREI